GLIPRPPEILPLALEGEKHLSPLPLVAEPWASTTQLIRILLTNLGALLADGLRGHGHPAVEPEFCHLPEAPTASDVQPPRVTDDFARQPWILLFRGRGRGVLPATLSHGVATRQVDNAGRGHPGQSGSGWSARSAPVLPFHYWLLLRGAHGGRKCRRGENSPICPQPSWGYRGEDPFLLSVVY